MEFACAPCFCLYLFKSNIFLVPQSKNMQVRSIGNLNSSRPCEDLGTSPVCLSLPSPYESGGRLQQTTNSFILKKDGWSMAG